MSINAVACNVVQALECGRIGLSTLISLIHAEHTTDADAYVAYVAVTTYLKEHNPDEYEEAVNSLKTFMQLHHPKVMT